MQELYLYHYGVKGMRWGVRKERRAQKKQYQSDSYEVVRKFRQVTNGALDEDYSRRRYEHDSNYAQANKNPKKQFKLDTQAQKSLEEYNQSKESYKKSKAEFIEVGRKFCDKYSNEKVSELFGSKSDTARSRVNIETFIDRLELGLYY